MEFFTKPERQLPIEPLLLEVADVLSTSLDLDTTLRRVSGSRAQSHRLRDFRYFFC